MMNQHTNGAREKNYVLVIFDCATIPLTVYPRALSVTRTILTLFQLLPSGKWYCSFKAQINRLIDSFPQTIRLELISLMVFL